MKCNAKVVWQTRRRKGNGKEYQFPSATYGSNADPKIIPDKATTCNGKIIASVDLDSDYGGCSCCSSYSVKVSYKCKTCGHSFYPELPTEYTISEFLTNAIENL